MKKAMGIRLEEELIKKIKIIAINENRKVSNLVACWILEKLKKHDRQ